MKNRTLQQIEWEEGRTIFVFALADILKFGTDKISKLTDEEIDKSFERKRKEEEESDGKPIIPVEGFVRAVKVAREIAQMDMPIDKFITEITNMDLFDNPKRPISWDRLSEIATVGIGICLENDCNEELEDMLELDEDEREYFGMETEDEDDDI